MSELLFLMKNDLIRFSQNVSLAYEMKMVFVVVRQYVEQGNYCLNCFSKRVNENPNGESEMAFGMSIFRSNKQ